MDAITAMRDRFVSNFRVSRDHEDSDVAFNVRVPKEPQQLRTTRVSRTRVELSSTEAFSLTKRPI